MAGGKRALTSRTQWPDKAVLNEVTCLSGDCEHRCPVGAFDLDEITIAMGRIEAALRREEGPNKAEALRILAALELPNGERSCDEITLDSPVSVLARFGLSTREINAIEESGGVFTLEGVRDYLANPGSHPHWNNTGEVFADSLSRAFADCMTAMRGCREARRRRVLEAEMAMAGVGVVGVADVEDGE